MKIGILTSRDKNLNSKEVYVVYKSILNYIGNDNIIIPIVSFNKLDNIKKIIDEIDCVIIEGGSSYTNKDLKIVKYLYDKDIPTLGICLGMQMMSMAFNGKMEKTRGHMNTYHSVYIDPFSKIYSILKTDHIKVNSRHNYKITKTSLTVSGISDVIEIVEDKNKSFFIGLQYHPEDLDTIESKKIINYFLKCGIKHANK